MAWSGEALAVDHVSVSFPGRQVLQQVNFELAAGEVCGLIGPNGSGKTTLLRTIAGFQKPDEGSVRIARDGKRPLIGYVPQKIDFDPGIPMRARDLVELGLDGNRLGLPLPWNRKRRARIDAMLEAVGAAGFGDTRVGELSGGQQQRVMIAHALIRQPRLLLLDEPLANLDLPSVAGVVALLRRLSTERGIAVLLSAHDMNPLLSVMDRIVYLVGGRAACGTASDVVQADVLSRLYGSPIDVIRARGRVLVVAAEALAPVADPIAADLNMTVGTAPARARDRS